MKKFKYRIKHAPPMGWYAQVYKGWLEGWKTIGGLWRNEYDEYDSHDIRGALETKDKALEVVRSYSESNDPKFKTVTYYDVKL